MWNASNVVSVIGSVCSTPSASKLIRLEHEPAMLPRPLVLNAVARGPSFSLCSIRKFRFASWVIWTLLIYRNVMIVITYGDVFVVHVVNKFLPKFMRCLFS